MAFLSTGLEIETVAEIRQDIRDEVTASSILGPTVSTGGDSTLGVLIDTVADGLGNMWQTLQAVVDSQDPDTAQGLATDSIGAIRGIEREAATTSTGTLTLGGTAGTVIPAGSQARVASGTIVETLSETTLPDTINAQAIETGPIEIGAGTIDTIVTSIPGWTTVTNADAFDTGSDIESDAEYRLRQRRLMISSGKCTDQDLTSALDDLDTVDEAYVYSNRTSSVDSYGVPAHRFLSVIHPSSADRDEIALAIWENQPMGIGSHGDESENVIDDYGYSQPIEFSFASEVAVYVWAVLTTDSDYPSNGDELVEDAILEETARLGIADDVNIARIEASIAERTDEGITKIPGITTLEVRLNIGSLPGPSDLSNITIDLDEISSVLGGYILVTST